MPDKTDGDTFQAVRRFVAEELLVKPDRITPETTLLHDLGVDGLDAVEFFERFFEVFDVDSAGFELVRHFGPEGDMLIYGLWSLVARAFGADAGGRLLPITVADLVDAAGTKKWPYERFSAAG